LVSESSSHLIIISGGSGSGKTTFARKLSSSLGEERSAIVELDCYYRPLSHLSIDERSLVNFDAPGALDFDLLSLHISNLLEGGAIECPQYDYAVHDRKAECRIVSPRKFIILEGILALHEPHLRELSTLSIYIETCNETRFQRRALRDRIERQRSLESIKEQWNSSVLPMHRQYCESGKQFANLILDGESEFEPHIEQVKSAMLKLAKV